MLNEVKHLADIRCLLIAAAPVTFYVFGDETDVNTRTPSPPPPRPPPPHAAAADARRMARRVVLAGGHGGFRRARVRGPRDQLARPRRERPAALDQYVRPARLCGRS